MRTALVALCLTLSACSAYRDFSLPSLTAKPGKVSWAFVVRPQPVMGNVPGYIDVLNPSVVPVGGALLNLYSAYDGKAWHTGVAKSADGIAWTIVKPRVLSPDGDYIAANGSAARDGREFLYWFQTGREPRIALARSADGIDWRRESGSVLEVGPRGSWDERGVADPYVIRAGDAFYMYYLGQDRAERQRLGVARSSDAVHWAKYKSNPILELGGPGAFDEIGLGEPAVFVSEGSYWMLYTGRDRKERRAMGLARSQDGVHWTRVTTAPVLTGNQQWMSAVVCDPSVIADRTGVRVWFGGGDRAEPAENLHGQIGFAELRLRVEPVSH